MKGKVEAKTWDFYSNLEEVEGTTIEDILRTFLVFSTIGVNVIVTNFTGTILLEEDLEKGDLPHLDTEAFIIPTGPRFLVPQPVDKEGRKLFFKGTYIPSLVIIPRCKDGLLKDYPLFDHPYYVWTEVPEEMEVASPMVAEVGKLDGDVKA